jgi:hypothetical protein
MGRHEIALLIPLLALAIPVAAVILGGMQKIAKLRLEETRLRFGGGGADPGEMQALRNEVETMRGELTELQERVDFAERMLANPNRSGDSARGANPQGEAS